MKKVFKMILATSIFSICAGMTPILAGEDNDIPYRLKIKEYMANSSVYLTAENNNNNALHYYVAGYWDEETGK